MLTPAARSVMSVVIASTSPHLKKLEIFVHGIALVIIPNNAPAVEILTSMVSTRGFIHTTKLKDVLDMFAHRSEEVRRLQAMFVNDKRTSEISRVECKTTQIGCKRQSCPPVRDISIWWSVPWIIETLYVRPSSGAPPSGRTRLWSLARRASTMFLFTYAIPKNMRISQIVRRMQARLDYRSR